MHNKNFTGSDKAEEQVWPVHAVRIKNTNSGLIGLRKKFSGSRASNKKKPIYFFTKISIKFGK